MSLTMQLVKVLPAKEDYSGSCQALIYTWAEICPASILNRIWENSSNNIICLWHACMPSRCPKSDFWHKFTQPNLQFSRFCFQGVGLNRLLEAIELANAKRKLEHACIQKIPKLKHASDNLTKGKVAGVLHNHTTGWVIASHQIRQAQVTLIV